VPEQQRGAGRFVADPFCGSGSKLIAAGLSNRRFTGMDIDPKYCDVAVIRWQNLFSKSARLVERHLFLLFSASAVRGAKA
jgi:DNA modification methylase